MLAFPHVRRSSRLWLTALLAVVAAALLLPSSAAAAPGAVYTQTNDPAGNEVVVLARAPNGSLTEIQRVATGGTGIHGNPPFGQAHLDSQNAVELTDNGRLLFTVNAGSDTVSAFRVGPHGHLTLVDVESSGGDRPISVDSHNGLLYVLNLDSNTISGLRYTNKGEMTPIAGSTEPLSTTAPHGPFPGPLPAQVGFSPDGDVLTVTLRLANRIDTFAVNADGTTGPATANASNADTPFSFDYDNKGRLVVANAGPLGGPTPFNGSGSTYALSGSTLAPLDNEDSGADALATCWVVVTNNGRYAFMTNTASGGVSRFRLAPDGSLTLLGVTPTSQPLPAGPSDTTLSQNARYLYVLNVFSPEATIDVYRVKANGSLIHLGEVHSNLPVGTTGLAAK